MGAGASSASWELAERLAGLGAKVVVPATLNVAGVDPHGWERWAVPPGWAEKARRQMVAYQSMGCIPSWTCAPYQTEARPAFGDQIALGESSAIVFANSVLGARTERYPDLLDICAAITGRVPAAGLHLTENRAGQVLFRFHDIPPALLASDELYPVLGHLVGKVAGDRVAVLDGLDVTPSEDQLKAFGAGPGSGDPRRRPLAHLMASGDAMVLAGRALIPGEASMSLLVSHEPLSFWGGYAAATGEVIDRRHPLSGENAAGRILAIPGTRGSSTTTAVLLEAIRQGTTPAAILTSGTDSFLALSAIVADEMYGKAPPLVALGEEDFHRLVSGRWSSGTSAAEGWPAQSCSHRIRTR